MNVPFIPDDPGCLVPHPFNDPPPYFMDDAPASLEFRQGYRLGLAMGLLFSFLAAALVWAIAAGPSPWGFLLAGTF